MNPPQDRSLASRAEGLFAELLVRAGDAPRAEIDALRAQHPELAGELDELYLQRERMRTLEARAAGSIAPGLASAAASSRSDSTPGVRLGSFELLRLLGRGGMGEVWEARDHSLQRRVALKLLPLGSSDSAREQSRFRREAEAAGRVQHRGIVVVLSAGEVEGRRYIAQELVPGGRTLRHLLDELRRLPELPADHYSRMARLFFELTDALESAHAAGIVHRDLKPQNILLASDGSPKVADFGLARLEGDVSLSRTGDFLGTYYYASPEQAAPSERAADARSDVFSLGVSLYECLTLRRPFDGDSIQQVVQAILSVDPPDPRTVFSRVPADLALISLKALEKKPEARYASMAAFREDLRRHLADEPILARAPSAVRRAQKWMLRHPTLSTATAVGAVALLTVTLLFVRSVRARNDAVEARNDLASANADLKQARDDAVGSAAKVQAQAEEVRRESTAREAVIQFLIGIFSSANPELEDLDRTSARELLARGVDALRTASDMDQQVRARLWTTMGDLYEKLGRYQAAKEYLLEAESIWLSLGLTDHPEMHSVASSLAMIEYHLGDLASAERRLEPLVDRTGSDWAGNPQLPWIVRNTLARVRLEQGRFAESRALYEESLELCREVNDEGSMNVFGARKDLAGLEWLAGNKALAESMLRDLIAAAEEQIKAANPAALEAVNILGMVLADTQRLDEAESLFQGMADDLAARLDPGHPSLLVVQGNLACVLERKGELESAERLYRELIAVRTELYGRGDAGTLDLLNNLGTCLSGQQRYAEAEEVHRETLDRRRELYGPDSPLSLNAQNNLAFDVFKQGRASEALELQAEVVQRTLPDDPNLGGRRIMLEDLRRAVQAETSPAPSASDPR